jgi:hypothetical protein
MQENLTKFNSMKYKDKRLHDFNVKNSSAQNATKYEPYTDYEDILDDHEHTQYKFRVDTKIFL